MENIWSGPHGISMAIHCLCHLLWWYLDKYDIWQQVLISQVLLCVFTDLCPVFLLCKLCQCKLGQDLVDHNISKSRQLKIELLNSPKGKYGFSTKTDAVPRPHQGPPYLGQCHPYLGQYLLATVSGTTRLYTVNVGDVGNNSLNCHSQNFKLIIKYLCDNIHTDMTLISPPEKSA